MNDEVNYDRASVMQNADFICIDTWSGYYGSSRDPKGRQHLLSPDADARAIGEALIDALSCSRVALPEEAPDLYPNREGMALEYAQWVDTLMQRYGYKTRRALFKKMKSCSAHRRRGATLVVFPTVHDRLEGWSALPDDQNVVIGSESSPDDVGAAVQLALARCLA